MLPYYRAYTFILHFGCLYLFHSKTSKYLLNHVFNEAPFNSSQCDVVRSLLDFAIFPSFQLFSFIPFRRFCNTRRNLHVIKIMLINFRRKTGSVSNDKALRTFFFFFFFFRKSEWQTKKEEAKFVINVLLFCCRNRFLIYRADSLSTKNKSTMGNN